VEVVAAAGVPESALITEHTPAGRVNPRPVVLCAAAICATWG
jgi:hypothetical protein